MFCSAPPGDLYVYLDIEEIPEIQRDGINLISTVSVGYLDAILGAVVKVILHDICLGSFHILIRMWNKIVIPYSLYAVSLL